MKHITTHLKLLLVATIWGAGWVAGRVISTGIPPITGAWIRYVIAVLCFLIWMKIAGLLRLPTMGEWKRVWWIGFFSTFVYQAFFMFGMKYTAAGDASLMITFNPLFTALLAIPFLDEKMNKKLLIGLLSAFSGVLILYFHSPNVDIPAWSRTLGDALIMLAALAWASSTILMKKAMASPAPDAELPLTPLGLTVWASVIGLGILTPWAAIETYQQGIPSISNEVWISILFLAILSTVVSYVWFAEGIKTIGAGKAALYVYLVPVFGIISGWLLIDEKLGWSLLVAFVLIVGGVALAQSEKGDESGTSA